MINRKAQKNKYIAGLPAYNVVIVLALVVGLSILGYYIMSSKAGTPQSPTPAATPYIRLFSELNNASEAKSVNNATGVEQLKTWYKHVHGEASSPNSFSLGNTTKTSASDTTLAKKLSDAGVWSSQYRNGSYVSQSNSGEPLFGEANDIEHNAPLAIATYWPGNYAPYQPGSNTGAGARLVGVVSNSDATISVNVSSLRPAGKPATWPFINSQDVNSDGYSNSTADYVSWLRIGNEIMQITGNPSETGGTITMPVKRAFLGTVASAHSAQERVMAPLYIGSSQAVASDQVLSGIPGLNNSSKPLRYGIKIWQADGINWIAGRIKSTFGPDMQGYNTTWLDVSSCNQYNNAAYDGTQVWGWNDAASIKLTRDSWGNAQLQKLAGLRGQLPNVKFTANSLFGADAARNNACTDNLLANFDGGVLEHWLKGSDGYNYDWAQAMDQNFKIQQNNWPAQYWIRWNYDYAGDINQYKRFTYGALLLAYNPAADRYQYGGAWGKNSPDPLYFYDFGAPQTTLNNVEQGSVAGQAGLYRRDFKNGFVLVNASASPVTYNLDKSYYKLDVAGNPTLVQSVTIGARDAAFLFHATTMGSSPAPTPTATSTPVPTPTNAPPTAPGELSATATSANQVNLSWQASQDDKSVGGYVVLRDGVKIANVSSTGFSDSTVQPATTYKYQVQAYDSDQATSQLSNEVVVTTSKAADTSKPSAPTGLKVAPSTTSALANWSASSDDSGVVDYVLSIGEQTLTTPMLQYSIIGLTSKTQYTLTVRARDVAGNMSDPASVRFTTTCKRFMWWCW